MSSDGRVQVELTVEAKHIVCLGHEKSLNWTMKLRVEGYFLFSPISPPYFSRRCQMIFGRLAIRTPYYVHQSSTDVSSDESDDSRQGLFFSRSSLTQVLNFDRNTRFVVETCSLLVLERHHGIDFPIWLDLAAPPWQHTARSKLSERNARYLVESWWISKRKFEN